MGNTGWGTPVRNTEHPEREFKRHIYITDPASYRSASLSYYDHRQFSIISVALHPPDYLVILILPPHYCLAT